MLNEHMFRSSNADWTTPREFFAVFNGVYRFGLDVCADKRNAMVDPYINEQMDGLKQDWSDWPGAKWMNPPYGNQVKHWVHKALGEFLAGNDIVILLPNRSDTGWYQGHLAEATDLLLISGRLAFLRPCLYCGTLAGRLYHPPAELCWLYHEGAMRPRPGGYKDSAWVPLCDSHAGLSNTPKGRRSTAPFPSMVAFFTHKPVPHKPFDDMGMFVRPAKAGKLLSRQQGTVVPYTVGSTLEYPPTVA